MMFLVFVLNVSVLSKRETCRVQSQVVVPAWCLQFSLTAFAGFTIHTYLLDYPAFDSIEVVSKLFQKTEDGWKIRTLFNGFVWKCGTCNYILIRIFSNVNCNWIPLTYPIFGETLLPVPKFFLFPAMPLGSCLRRSQNHFGSYDLIRGDPCWNASSRYHGMGVPLSTFSWCVGLEIRGLDPLDLDILGPSWTPWMFWTWIFTLHWPR